MTEETPVETQMHASIVASEPIQFDANKKHADRLLMLNTVAKVINYLKPIACAGVLDLSPYGETNDVQNRYILNCRMRVPELGVTVTLTRDRSQSLAENLHLGFMVHLSLEPLPPAYMADMARKYPAFRQVAELDETSARDWFTTAFAPFHDECWVERRADGSLNFRLFTDPDFASAKTIWSNQARSLVQTLDWHSVKELA